LYAAALFYDNRAMQKKLSKPDSNQLSVMLVGWYRHLAQSISRLKKSAYQQTTS
jgi:hypothetical protein